MDVRYCGRGSPAAGDDDRSRRPHRSPNRPRRPPQVTCTPTGAARHRHTERHATPTRAAATDGAADDGTANRDPCATHGPPRAPRHRRRPRRPRLRRPTRRLRPERGVRRLIGVRDPAAERPRNRPPTSLDLCVPTAQRAPRRAPAPPSGAGDSTASSAGPRPTPSVAHHATWHGPRRHDVDGERFPGCRRHPERTLWLTPPRRHARWRRQDDPVVDAPAPADAAGAFARPSRRWQPTSPSVAGRPSSAKCAAARWPAAGRPLATRLRREI